jgi:hypothetical protein
MTTVGALDAKLEPAIIERPGLTTTRVYNGSGRLASMGRAGGRMRGTGVYATARSIQSQASHGLSGQWFLLEFDLA